MRRVSWISGFPRCPGGSGDAPPSLALPSPRPWERSVQRPSAVGSNYPPLQPIALLPRS